MLKPSLLAGLILALTSCHNPLPPPPRESVGNTIDGKTIVTTLQLIHPAGESVEFAGRPVDLVLSPDGKTLYVKDNHSLFSLDVGSWKVCHTLPFGEKEGGSMFGLTISPDGQKLYATSTLNRLREATISPDGKLTWARTFELKGTDPNAKTGPKTTSYPCGVTLSRDARTAYVCLSINNTLAVVDLAGNNPSTEIPVGVAPYAVVLSPDGHLAYVTNWGGRRSKKGEKTAKSAGTETLVDDRGVASSGTVSVIDLHQKKEIAQIPVGLHPAGIISDAAGARLYVANANSDTVSVIDTASRKVIDTILVRPDPTLPFGSAANALALSPEHKQLYVANGGNNAVAVVSLNEGAPSHVEGFIPAGWYPGAIVTDGHQLFVANTKGLGSRQAKPKQTHWAVQQYQGTITKVDIPAAEQLSGYTEQVRNDSRVPQTLAAWEKAQSDVKPVPVPQRVGEPSVFEHVVYVIKENRTYDQVLGDVGKGNSDPSLCVFGKTATPNLHALAEQFVLLDNFYCNGVVSADGHAWATEGLAVDYLEKSFGGFVRSYPFGGDDPLAFASSGFIWDNVLLHGKSFRNYGEMVLTHLTPRTATFTDVYTDFHTGSKRAKLRHQISNANLRPYTCPDYPGWNLKIPDAMRMSVFMKEFEEYKHKGEWPNFVTVYLPSDHTSGTAEKAPIPAAMAADNDLAVGQLIDAISHSPFWATTCVFVIEDDPQAGFDHVDGHRSVCWVVSPYTKRKAIVSQFYNQTSVLHTMELIMGLPPMNQMDAMAPVMRDCFTDTPDLTPFTALPNRVPLNKMNPIKTKLAGQELHLAQTSEQQDFSEPDRVNDDAMNRIIWHAVKGVETPYPATYAGAHGKGLKALHLKPLDGDDDDD